MFGTDRTTLIWHRRDLRLHDNALYHIAETTRTLSVYVFDPAQFARVPSCVQPSIDVTRTGPHAAALLLKALAELRSQLRSRGGDLLVRHGDPASILPEIARLHSVDEVRWHEEPGAEEVATSKRVRSALRRARCRVTIELGCTLFHVNDLPRCDEWDQLAHPRQKMRSKKASRSAGAGVASDANVLDGSCGWRERLSSMPRVMGDWRRAVRARARPRHVLETMPLTCLGVLPGETEPGRLPALEDLMAPALLNNGQSGRLLFGLPDEVVHTVIMDAISFHQDSQAPQDSPLIATEAAAHARLLHFVGGGHASEADRSLADTSGNGSSKLSVPLSLGCLSPRQVVAAVAHHGDDGAGWLVSHMEMRDFFIYSCFAADSAMFRRDGWQPVHKKPARDDSGAVWRTPSEASEAWARWATGQMGLPLPDAGMREMMRTGMCSNRVRQNAASVLAKDLRIDWRAGAEWFQWILADHEVSANWGNWAYFAGVGSDPKQRHFRTISQAAKYDPHGAYVRRWLPELAVVADNPEALLRPHAYGVSEWPQPIVEPDSQLTWQDAERLSTTGRLSTESDRDSDATLTTHTSAESET